MKTVKGFSVSVYDVLAGASSLVGLLFTVFVGRSVGGAVYESTGSVWLGTTSWVGTLLVGVILFLGGIAYVLGASRSYRHSDDDAKVRVEL